MRNRRINQQGFVLLELLVVVSMIGFLASIVLVAFNSARARAADTRRFADIKQMSTAFYLYSVDNGSLPLESYGSYQINSNQDVWNTQLGAAMAPYLLKVPVPPNSMVGPYFYRVVPLGTEFCFNQTECVTAASGTVVLMMAYPQVPNNQLLSGDGGAFSGIFDIVLGGWELSDGGGGCPNPDGCIP